VVPTPAELTQLAQELMDDPNGTFARYAPKELQLEGTIDKTKGMGETIAGVMFKVPVTDKKTQAAKDYKIHCNFKTPLSADEARAANVASGQKIALHGKVTGVDLGSPQVTFNQCTLVK